MATLYVSPFGKNDNMGTLEAPFRTLQKGIDSLQAAGDTLFVRGGSYAEDVRVVRKEGSTASPIVIRAYARERVTVDGSEPLDIDGERSRFRIGGNDEWTLAREEDPDAHEEEYISRRTFHATKRSQVVRHGAFMDREPYTRLVTYSRLEDLRADNQTFGRLPLDDTLPPLPGFPVVDDEGNPKKVRLDNSLVDFKRPWVYMGPGLFFDGGGRIHIRLSHTTNKLPGLADYDGGVDPRQLRLAISQLTPSPLVIERCRSVRFDHVEFRFGGNQTVQIESSDDVEFDHVRVFAGSDGVRLGPDNNRVAFRHCEILGGIPTWMFRSDIKGEYSFKDGDSIITNRLGNGTSQTLFLGVASDTQTLISNCEFIDGHDLSMFGQGTRFHHNWIHNLHDDALIVDIEGTDDLEVSQNVIMKCLQAISLAHDNVGGERRVHRNLIDLRSPTAGIRPRPPHHLVDKDDVNEDGTVFRFGQLYKSNFADGAMDFFHNTCLVAKQTGLAGIQHYVNSGEQSKTRRSFNNILVNAVPDPDDASQHATAFLPKPTFRGPTDCNCFFQLAGEQSPLLRHAAYSCGGEQRPFDSFESLAAYRSGTGQNPKPNAQPNTHFEDSKALYSPGFEAHSIDEDPQFQRIAPDGVPQYDDNLRLKPDSPARQKGLDLSDSTIGIADPLAPHPGPPDLGCYQSDQPGLHVGVDGRRQFPQPSDSEEL